MRAERHRIILAPMLCAAAAATAHAEVIAFQDFQINTRVLSPLDGTGGAGSDAAANASFGTTAPGTFYDSNRGLRWTASYSNGASGSGGPIVGDESGDVIGVVDDATFPGSQPAPFVGVSNDLFDAVNRPGRWFHIDDSDGLITLAFDPINTTNFTDLAMSFAWAANQQASWESEDSFRVLVNDIVVFSRVGSELDLNTDITEFLTVDIDLSQFDGQPLSIVARFETNGAAEDIGFSDLEITGTLIPAPAAAFPLSLFSAFAASRRRR